jgi:hypothetical protein
MTLVERSVSQPEAIMEPLEICLRPTYFQRINKFFQKKEGTTMGNALLPVRFEVFTEATMKKTMKNR